MKTESSQEQDDCENKHLCYCCFRVKSNENESKTSRPASQQLSSCFKVQKSTMFALQAFVVWVVLCLPGNIVTIILYQKANSLMHQTHGMNDSLYFEHAYTKDMVSEDMMINIPSNNNHTLKSTTKGRGIEILPTSEPKFNVSSKYSESGMHTTEVKDTNDMMKENNHRINGSSLSEDYDNLCHEKFEEYGYLVTDLGNFWLEGILLLVVGVFGVAGNIMTIVVLRKMETNTTFNRLLMSLASCDTLLLFYYILDMGILGTFIRSNCESCEPYWYRVLYPYMLHPLKNIALTSSIFMVVAISAERHRAIVDPLNHRATFWPYLIWVGVMSGTFNIPKFFEFKHIDDERNGTHFLEYAPTVMNEDKSYITFSSWWDELIVTGIVPFLALVGFNSRIYLKLRASDKQEYRFVGQQKIPAEVPTMTVTTVAYVPSSDEDTISKTSIPLNGDNISNHRNSSPLALNKNSSRALSALSENRPNGGSIFPNVSIKISNAGPSLKNSSDNISFNETERKKSLNHCNETPFPYFQKKDQESHKVNGREINTVGEEIEMNAVPSTKDKKVNISNGHNEMGSDDVLTKNLEQNVREIEEERKLLRALVENSNSSSGSDKSKNRRKLSTDVTKKTFLPSSNNINATLTGSTATRSTHFSKPCISSEDLPTHSRSRGSSIESKHALCVRPLAGKIGHRHSLVPPSQMATRRFSASPLHLTAAKKLNKSKSICELNLTDRKMSTHFKQRTEKSGLVLGSIVLTFLFCHTFRLVIQVYEVTHPNVSTAERYAYCYDQGRFSVPVAFYVMLSASNLLLVVNSSINFIIYCCVGKRFRAKLKLVLSPIYQKIRLIR